MINISQYRVPYADVDQMHVVYYANYLIYFERGRTELLRQANITYAEMEASGLALPVIEAVCKYHQPARYDDMLSIKTWIGEIKGVRIKLNCQVYRDDQLLCEGHTWHACITDQGKPTRVPAYLKAI